ncbi:hypothetical protein [Terrisporobacter petrolearius]
MNTFLLNVLAGIIACALCGVAKFTYYKVKNHSNANKSGFNK